MTLTITTEQRGVLYDQILIRLSGIDGIWFAMREGDPGTAERLAREFSDVLRMLLDGFGFGEGTGEPVELTSPPDLLRRVFERLSQLVESQSTAESEAREQVEKDGEQRLLAQETCKSLLTALDTHAGR